jgi:hypothetical protein
VTGITARGSEAGMSEVLERIRMLEGQVSMPAELRRLEATSMTGIRGKSSQVIHDVAGELKRQNQRFRLEILGDATARFHLLGAGTKGKSGVAVGASFDLPLQIGGMVRGMPQALADPEGGYQQALRGADFIARGRMVRMGDKVVPSTWAEALGYDVRQTLRRQGAAATDQDLRDIARKIQKVAASGQEGLVFAGAEYMPIAKGQDMTQLMARGYQARAGSIYDLFQMGTVGVFREQGMTAAPLISEFADRSKFPFSGVGGRVFQPSQALQHIESFLDEARSLGIQASDRAIKAEAALAGNLGLWGLGEIVPFGESADPSRQAYQRLAIAQLAGRARPRDITSVSTPTVEAMKRYVAGPAGQKAKWSVESRLALVLDPRFEQAVAGSGGGAVISRKLASQLTADITQMADFEQARWTGMMERGGRILSRADVGTPLITSLGTKHTIASIAEMNKASMAVGWSTFLKGKTPEAMRETVIRDVVDQMGSFREKYRFEGGQRIAYKPAELARRDRLRQAMLQDIGKILSKKPGDVSVDIRQGMPQLLVGRDAAFGSSQLEQINQSIDQYNRILRKSSVRNQELGLQEIRKGFEISTMKIGGQKMRAMFVNASVMRRLEAAEVVTKAVGAWTRPASQTAILGFKEGVEYFSDEAGNLREVVDRLYHPRGIKLGMRDLTNLELYKTKEASELAGYYTKIIKDWSKFEKQQLYATTMPFFGVPGKEMSAVGFPDIKGAMEFKDFARKYGGKYQASAGGVEKTAAELAGTIFDPTSPMRREGMALKLPWEEGIELGGIPVKGTGRVDTIGTRQLYLPAIETYRGIMKDPSLVTPESAAYIGKLERAHEQLFLSLATENPDKKRVQLLAQKYYNTLGAAFGGKNGLVNYLTTARMAHSGYFGLVPGGAGTAAQALGTALDGPFTAQISETSAKQLGIYNILMESGKGDPFKGKIYGRVAAYPGIGPTMESVLQFKMAKDTELGAKRMRISNLLALTMFRDFDADKAGVTFLTGERAQHLSEQFYKKTVLPRLNWYQEIVRDDPELASIMAEDNPLNKQVAREIRDARQRSKADLMDYGKFIALSEAKDAKVQGKLADAVARKYTTKALTGPVNWYLTQFRMLAQQPEVGKDIARLGLPKTNMQMVGGVLGLLEQQAAITKGKEVAGGVQGVFRIMSTQYDMATQEGRGLYASAIDEGAEYLKQVAGYDPRVARQAGEAGAIAAGVGGRGEYAFLATGKSRQEAMRQLIHTGQVRLEALAKMQAGANVYTPLMRHMAKGVEHERGMHALGGMLFDIAERQSALSGDMSALNAASEKITQAAGFTKAAGLEWGTDVAGIQAAHEARVKAELAEMAALNQATKVEGRAVGMTILDRASRWWTRAETPYWQKAGVVTGAAIVLGSIAKNTLFPGYGGEGSAPGRGALGPPVGPPPVIMAPPYAPEAYDGPTGPMVAPQRAHKKPGGIWAYVQEQIGFGPASYGIDTGRGEMPMAKPIFGPRKHAPGIGIDIGPGIADSGSRPMMLTGPPVGGGAPLPPGIPSTSPSSPAVPYVSQLGEPPARMQTPEHMRPGMMVSALQPPMGGIPETDIGGMMGERLGGEVSLISDRWDPADGMIDRMVDSNNDSLSSFT